jgi:protein phosphatase
VTTTELSTGDAGALVLRVAGRTDAGRRRSENQDHFLIADLTPSPEAFVARPGAGGDSANVAASITPGEGGVLLLVADGMGGAAAGRLASGLACSFVLAELQEDHPDRDGASPFGERLRRAVENANNRIRQHALRNPEYTGMGTTATVAGVLGTRLYLAQVGDSRAYLLREGGVQQLTRDQSLVQQLVDSGAMTAEQAERSSHNNVVLQALGVEPTVTVDTGESVLHQGDTLLLCSDGLFRTVRATELAALVAQLEDPAVACEALVALANERGAPDNVTVVLAQLH